METIRTLSCKLVVPPLVAQRIDATMTAFADAYNLVADWGNDNKCHRQDDLHKGCYRVRPERQLGRPRYCTGRTPACRGGKAVG